MTCVPERAAEAVNEDGARATRAVGAGLAVLALLLCGLFYYKWTGSVRTIVAVWPAATWTTSASGLTGAVVAVLTLPPVLERVAGAGRVYSARSAIAAATMTDETSAPAAFIARFGRSVGRITVTTVPLIVVGVLAASLVLRANATLRPTNTPLGSVMIALVALLLTLPTFFELPIAPVALAAGVPALAAVILFAGPIMNLPSLLIVGKEAGARTALALVGGVWGLAVAVGLPVLAV